MPDSVRFLLERLKDEGDRTAKFFLSLSSEDWHKKIYSEGATWTVRQVLAHFVMAEEGILDLIEDIRAGGSGVPPDFNLNAYNERRVARLDEVNPAQLIERFQEQRRATIQKVSQLKEGDLNKIGRHPFLGMASIEEIVRLIYRHNQIHQRDVRKVISTGA